MLVAAFFFACMGRWSRWRQHFSSNEVVFYRSLFGLLGIVLWNEQLAHSSWLGIALIILSGVVSVHRTPERRSPLPALEKSPQAPTL